MSRSSYQADGGQLVGRQLLIVRVIVVVLFALLALVAIRYGIPPKRGMALNSAILLPIALVAIDVGIPLPVAAILGAVQFPLLAALICYWLGKRGWHSIFLRTACLYGGFVASALIIDWLVI